jgi:aspartyl/glutamyl-tRNA(Asn/Gln) amidotransferase C subunit
MSLTREDVAKVSLLGRLRLRDDELDRMTDQLTQIVSYMELLSEVTRTGSSRWLTRSSGRTCLPEIWPRPSLDRDAALSNAPKRDEQCYRVPPQGISLWKDGDVMSIHEFTATELLQRLASGELTAVRLCRPSWTGSNSTTDVSERFCGSTARERWPMRSRSTGGDVLAKRIGRLGGVAGGGQGCDLHAGPADDLRFEDARAFRPALRRDGDPALRQADAVLIGKTNMDEFAMGGTTENSAFAATRNPWEPGSGFPAVPAAERRRAWRPDGAAFDRQRHGRLDPPARFVLRRERDEADLRPVSRYGLIAFASSLDQIGPLARTAEDVALLLEVLAGHDPLDSTSADVPVPEYSKTVAQPLDGLTAGRGARAFRRGPGRRSRGGGARGAAVYQSLGARVKEVSLPHSKYAIATYYIIAPAKRPAIWLVTTACITATAPTKRRCWPSWRRAAGSGGARRRGGAGRSGFALGADVPPHAGRRIRPRGEAPDHAGDVCAESRLLRRLLPEGVEGAAADPQRL